jgi:hypothetical protein
MAMLATVRARPISQLIMTRLRSQRSISAPAGSEKIRYGRLASAAAMPAAAGESVIAKISSGYTTYEAEEPSVETTCPLQSSM